MQRIFPILFCLLISLSSCNRESPIYFVEFRYLYGVSDIPITAPITILKINPNGKSFLLKKKYLVKDSLTYIYENIFERRLYDKRLSLKYETRRITDSLNSIKDPSVLCDAYPSAIVYDYKTNKSIMSFLNECLKFAIDSVINEIINDSSWKLTSQNFKTDSILYAVEDSMRNKLNLKKFRMQINNDQTIKDIDIK